MAISFVNSGAVAAVNSSYSVGGGSDRLLVLTCIGGINTDTISAATYGGQAMTLVDKGNAGANRYIYVFYLLNPPSGSNAFSITDGGNFNNGFAADYSGVKQSAQPDAFGKTAATSVASNAKTITTIADNCWLIGGIWVATGSSSLTGQAGTTIRTQNGNNSANLDSNAAKTPAGNFALGVDFSTTVDDSVIIVASFAPAPAATTSADQYGYGDF